MPYQLSNSPELIKKLPKNAKKIWISAFNSAFENNKSEKLCVKIAWSAIKKAGYSKNDNGEWGRWN